MSPKFSDKTAVAVLLVAFAAFLAGCGDKNNVEPVKPSSQDQKDVTPETGTTGDEPRGPTAGTDDAETGDDSSRNGRGPDDASSGESGAGDEEAARAPVEVVVRDGRFTDSTTRRVHVPRSFQSN